MEEFELVVDAPLTLLQLVGRLHPAAVHLPIGATVLLLMHETAAFCDVRGFRDTGPWMVVVTLMSYLPGVATGWVRAAEFDSATLQEIVIHRNFMLLSFAMLFTAAAPRLVRNRVNGWYLAALLFVVVTMAFGSDLGGKLVYGADYFG